MTKGSTYRDGGRAASAALLLVLATACGIRGHPGPGEGRTPGDGASAGETEPLRAMVYNIRAGKDLAGEENLGRVAELIHDTGVDVVLLQEVDRGTERSGGVDQLAELERLTGFHGAFGRTLDYQGGEYGIAVLSRWPILSDTVVPLPIDPPQQRGGGSYEPRGAMVVRVATPAGPMGIVNTHLDASGEDHYRRQEVETVRSLAADLAARHPRTFVGGDFNAEPGSAVVRRMTAGGWMDAWTACGAAADGAGEGRTYPSDAPVKRIDYLFLAPALTCDSARVLETPTSDHRPLLVTVGGGSGS